MAGFPYLLAALALVASASGVAGLAMRLHDKVQTAGQEVVKVSDAAIKQESSMRTEIVLPRAETAMKSLMLCNAYAHSLPLHITDVERHQRLTGETPLSYKTCRTFRLPMKEGDRFEFRAGDTAIGTFFANHLPEGPMSLLLVAHRKRPDSLAVAFDSHAFAELDAAQLAVVDAYRGEEAGHLLIMDSASSQTAKKRAEKLSFNTVMAVNPGKYEVALLDGSEASVAALPLEASSKGKFVVMRVGGVSASSLAQMSQGQGSFGQELVVFAEVSSNARKACLSLLVSLGALFVGLLSAA